MLQFLKDFLILFLESYFGCKILSSKYCIFYNITILVLVLCTVRIDIVED